VTVSADLRNTVARALAAINEDWTVFYKPADAVSDPAFMVTWGPDLWRSPSTVAADVAALEILVIAGRTDTDSAHDTLEAMIDAAIPALLEAGHRHHGVTPPARLDLGGIAYLTARIQLTAPLSTRNT
jgi:hypothetical protein